MSHVRSLLPLSITCLALMTNCHGGDKPWAPAIADPASLRTTPLGPVVGGENRAGGHAWLGIPFAAPPLGDLRWRAPHPAVAWKETRQSLTPAAACPQFATPFGGVPGLKAGEVGGSEDCLYLNVWAPKYGPTQVPKNKDRLPVMFWIHGGGNSVGNASFYDGGFLSKNENVIVVTVQYRLGPMGWFRHSSLRAETTDPVEQSGNFGTLDLIQGLQWVRDNIAAFGGDPNNVTVFGESAGGMDTYTMLLAPQAKGLFHRAIVESGGLAGTSVDFAEHFTDADDEPGHKNSSNEVLLRLLQHAGLAQGRASARARLATMKDADVAAFLRKQSAADLLNAYDFNRALGMVDMPLVFHDGVVLPQGDWTEQFATPQGWNHVPVILGSNKDEDKLFLFFDPRQINRHLGIVPRFVDETNYEATAEYVSRSWKCGSVDLPAAAMRRSGAADVFAYRFDWHAEPTVFGADLSKMLGAAHAMEIPFVFGHFNLGKEGSRLFTQENAPEREQLSNTMMSYWGQFARAGSPGRGAHEEQYPWTAWDDSAPGRSKYIVLDTQSEGGLHMVADTQSRERIVADIDADPRLPTQLEKCRVFHQIVGWTHGLSLKAYEKAGKKGCAAFPFETYPWAETFKD